MSWISPEYADWWYDLSWKGIIVAGGIAAFATAATVMFTVIQFWSDGVRDERAEQQRKEMSLLLAQANQKTEELRADNLELQKIMQPRRLGSIISITSPDDPNVPPAASVQFDGIKKFADVPVLIQVVPDFEAQTLANDMMFVLSAFGWRPQIVNESVTHVPPNLIFDGVRVTYTRGSKFVAPATALADGLTKAGLTGPSGSGTSRVFAQGLSVNPDGSPAQFPPDPNIDASVDAVIVLVGMKPIPPARATPK